MVESAILDVCGFLKAKHILIQSQNQWLRGSIACLRESDRNCTPNQLKDFVFTQWKLADLRDVSAPSLPKNCKTAAKLILPGKYAVQINYVINIGESFYKQLQSIRRPAAEDNLSVDTELDKGHTEISANRTLKFEITDGLITLLGFEDRQIKKLVEPFVPGVKAILTGPIECRKGVLFLKNENIDLIGGEVDTLHIPNAAENLVARALKQPENPDPYKSLDSDGTNNIQDPLLEIPQDDEDFLQIPDDFGVTQTSSAPLPRSFSNDNSSRNVSTSSSARTESYNEDTFAQSTFNRSSRSESTREAIIASSNGTNSVETITLDGSLNSSIIELEDDDEFALMAAQTASLAEETAKTSRQLNAKQTNLHNFFSKNIKNSERRECQSSISDKTNNKDSRNPTEKRIKSKAASNEIDLRAQLEESYSNFTTSDNQPGNDTYKSIFQKESRKTPSETKETDIFLKSKKESKEKSHDKRSHKTLSFPPTKYPCVQTVRGTVQTISQKLRIQEEEWTLSALIKVESVEVDVDFSPQVLNKIIGMTAIELNSKRKEVKHNAPLKEKLNDILKNSQHKLKSLDCDFKIQFTSYIAKPLVLEIFD